MSTYFDDCIILLCCLIMHFKLDFFHRKKIGLCVPGCDFLLPRNLWSGRITINRKNRIIVCVWLLSGIGPILIVEIQRFFCSLFVISALRFHVTVIKELLGRRERRIWKTPQNFHMGISEIAFKLNNEVVSEFDSIPLWQNLFYTVSELKKTIEFH